jgi:hypothetical protein
VLEDLRRSEIRTKVIAVFQDNTKLQKFCVDIEKALIKQRVFVTAGVPLKGSCDAGRDAHPRLE